MTQGLASAVLDEISRRSYILPVSEQTALLVLPWRWKKVAAFHKL